jgi:hypothetical protein
MRREYIFFNGNLTFDHDTAFLECFDSNPAMRNLTKLLVFTALLCVVLVFWGGPEAYSSRCFQQAWNLGHPLLFGMLTYLTLKWLKTVSNLIVL